MSTPPSELPQTPNVAEHATSTNTESTDLLAGQAEEKNEPEYVDLPQGSEISEAAALDLAKSRPVQWIVLAGPSDSGKTTLLTSLYELFQWRAIEQYAFAGSNTLPAFEERCYLSRRDSGSLVPHTQRTLYKGPDPLYLHLRIRSTEGLRPFRDFLFTDVSGEMFDHARDFTAECREMQFLKRANHFLLLLDSQKGVQREARWAMLEQAKALLRSCVDCQMIAERCKVNVVWSRFDYFAAEDANDAHRSFRRDVEAELRATFDRHIPNLGFSQVAARPLKAPTLGIGHGLPALLKQWATSSESSTPNLLPQSYSGARESELFAARHFASLTDNEQSSA